MTTPISTRILTGLLLGTTLLASGCDKVANTSSSIQTIASREYNDTASSWKDFFTYHPPMPDPLPQTRYCYQMQSDVVCYDSEQANLTSKMVGYQDGERMSWIQPGGGSLGASGGPAIALRPMPANPPNPAMASSANSSLNTGPVIDTTSAGTLTTEVPKAGQINIGNLPPTTSTSQRITPN